MKALRFTAPQAMAINELPVPTVGDDDVLLAARSVGICHSDIDLLNDQYIIPFEYPITPGHEWSAEVMDVGKSVTKFRPGDRVVGECVVGGEHFGFSINGAMSEFFVAKEAWLHKLPDNVTWTQGALVEPFSCGYYATLRADNLDASDTAIVFGAGPIGLGVVAAASAKGARVIVVAPSEKRASIALELGAELHLNPNSPTFVEEALDASRGGATAVFEASGNPTAMAAALDVAGYRARIVNIGINVTESVPARLGQVQSKELQIRGTIGSPGVWPETIRFLSRTGIDLSRIVTTTLPMREADKAYETVLTDSTQLKVHVTSQAS